MTDYRLPTNVVPVHYDLYLYPDLTTANSGSFTGRVTITVSVEEVTETVKIHNNGLTIGEVTIDGNPCTTALDTTHELLIITSQNGPLSVGECEVIIEFSGSMENRIVGLYISSYTNGEGEERRMATSKFEPTYARQAYPCFDEPNMKATFTVHLLKPNDDSYIALSNMPQSYEEDVENGIMVHFEESVKMPTYLTCFIVSDFAYTNETLKNGQEFRVYATPEQVEKTEYAKDIGKSVIDYFIDYFDIDFPLPKLDMAAIPDFVSGAMEHWGLVTFRETALLYSEDSSSSANKQRIATVVSHELAHSWFGNLVTMNWWNDLWLNEGFATYIEYKGVDYAEPDWQMMDQFIIADVHPVLILDATLGSHPIVQTVVTPDEITAIFDTISYSKGGSILRMLEHAVGEEVFKQGVTSYLNSHSYGNAVTQDLWDALQETTEDNISITEFMNTWTMQMGYPVIDITTVNDDTYILRQRRYLTDPEATDNTVTPYNYRWTIPITYITSAVSTPQYIWFNYTNDQISLAKPDGDWIKFNYNQVGYYRVNYEQDDWDRLADNMPSLSIADRAHLLEESFRLAQSGDISYEIPLNLSKYMKDEVEYIPWSVVATMLQELDKYLATSQGYTEYKNFVQDIVSTAYEALTWNEALDEDHLKRRARVVVLNLACAMGHSSCLTEATNRFQTWVTDSGSDALSQDLRAIIYNYGTAGSTAANWELLYNNFVRETDASEKLRLMQALTYTTDTSLLTRLIEIAKTEDVVRGQDYFTLMQYIAANSIGTPIVWDYVREHWEELVDRFGLNERYLGRMIPSITQRFITTTKLEEMRAFFEKYPDAGAGASARVQALETVENNIKWVQKYKQSVEDWVTDYFDES